MIFFVKNSYYDYDKDMEIEFFDYHLGKKISIFLILRNWGI